LVPFSQFIFSFYFEGLFMVFRLQVLTGALSLAACCIAGCGPKNTAKVDGVITLNGKPLEDIRVLFQPQNQTSETAAIGSFGLTDSEGRFSLKFSDTQADGAAVGMHTVILADKLTEGEEDSDAGDIGKGPRSRIPPKYTRQPPTFEVKPGVVNQAEIELTTK
jgi:hypothetical protein